MNRLFIFCFKSCLKGDNDTELYDVLELDPAKSDLEAIKKQFKKISLTLHPVPMSIGAVIKFKLNLDINLIKI